MVPSKKTVTRERKKANDTSKKQSSKYKLTKKIKQIKGRLGLECPICLEDLGVLSVSATVCGHVFCTSCLEKALKVTRRCPSCRKVVTRGKPYRLYLKDNICEEREIKHEDK